ncbi:acyl-CoA thioesterase [Halorubellus sp. JP-L1]|uniref:acyl-CoA thioesterase n=1 Tax=Halorubellus sp. JP-L1 TaxID=2715753 RepID=UPI0014078888|nr:thioesterase family protein [Halorubellus sp. JP-L1]NHN40197.1 acyl-CoA thioesterase [Halorubellus sp. JP-L1]
MDDKSYAVEVDVRYQDVDALGHVNNAIYATYLEEARVEYLQDVLGDVEIEAVIANLEIDFLRPVTMDDDHVTVHIAVADLGTKSITFEYEVYATDELAATASTVQVAYDRESREAVELPDRYHERVREFEGLD